VVKTDPDDAQANLDSNMENQAQCRRCEMLDDDGDHRHRRATLVAELDPPPRAEIGDERE
jgi:hypothetical protein